MTPKTLVSIFAAVGLTAGLVAASEPIQSGLRPWLDYRTIIWIGDSAYKKPDKLALFFDRLREMGINTAMVHGEATPQPCVDNHFPFYVENIVNRGLCLKWNSNVTDWDKFVTGWVKAGRPEAALKRHYCLDDPQWRTQAAQQVRKIVSRNMPFTPLAYNLRDELSTTISANPFDYDFNPIALDHFRAWLKTQYAGLPALNAEWETTFESWDDVRPFTTDEIKNRMASGDARPAGKPDWQALQAVKFAPATADHSPTRWNFAPWADFRTYMDVSLSSALNELRRTAHELDPQTPVGIEGTQMPHAFGGYDLWRLSQSLDWVEPYDIGCAREIFGSFMPGRPILTTVFEKDTEHALRRLWHLLLEGDRGCIVWWSEDCINWASPEYNLTPKAKALAPALKAMTSPAARLFLRAEPVHDPVLIHYSQPSIQVDWLLESTVDGSTWLRRFSSFEAEHNRMARVRSGWLKALQDLGYSPQFISDAQIDSGGLKPGVALILPNSWALSDKTAAQIQSWMHSSAAHLLFWDLLPGRFNEHGKLRQNPALAGLLLESQSASPNLNCLSKPDAKQASAPGDMADYAVERVKNSPSREPVSWLAAQLKTLRPEIAVEHSNRVRIHRFRVARGRLVAFERNIEYHMSEELKQAGGNEALEKPVELEAKLDQPAHVYDLRSEKYLGFTRQFRFKLDPWQPSLFALTPKPLPADKILPSLSGE